MTRFNTGNPVPSTDPRDRSDNSQAFDEAVNSEDATFNDRTGKSRLTLKGMEQVFDGGQPAIDAYYDALAEADRAQSEADRSSTEADRAEMGAEAALTSGWIYETTADGEAARADGDYFWVVSQDSDELLELWKMGASSATDTGKRSVSAASLPAIQKTPVSGNIVDPSGTRIEQYRVSTDGITYTGAGFSVTRFPVIAGKTIVTNEDRSSVLFYRSSDDSYLTVNTSTVHSPFDSTHTFKSVQVPSGYDELAINTGSTPAGQIDDTYYLQYGNYIAPAASGPFSPEITALNSTGISGDKQSIEASLIETGADNLLNYRDTADGYVASSGISFGYGNGWRHSRIPVSEGEVLVLVGPNVDMKCAWMDSGDNLLGTIPVETNLAGDQRRLVVPSGQNVTRLALNTWLSFDYIATNVLRKCDVGGNTAPAAYERGASEILGHKLVDEKAREWLGHIYHKPVNRYFRKTLFYFGDSITAGTEGGYVKYINEVLKCEATNYGDSGATVSRLVDIMTPLPNRQTSEKNFPTQPDYTESAAITIMIGTNNGIVGGTFVTGSISDIPAESANDIPYTPQSGPQVTTIDEHLERFPNTGYGNMGILIEYAKYINPEVEIFLISPPVNDRGGNQDEIEGHLKTISDFYALRFINAKIECGVNMKDLMRYSYDGTHMNTLGNKLLGNYIAYKIANS